jgi:tetratricopeptide (TPR) repeat protein
VSSVPPGSLAEEYFTLASSLDDGSPETQERAAEGYRQALALEPCLVPALINLANIHYAREFLIEAQALYERAVMLEPEAFEGYFNLGNIHHDLGRYDEAEGYYLQALAINQSYPEAHLYLAVALEKAGRTEDARAHWRAYHSLAPNGEWADLAREFSE